MQTKSTVADITNTTISHYKRNPQGYWEGTKDHDVSQNYAHFLKAMPADIPLNILDFGCGPGRDLRYFSSLGHRPYGLDGCEAFCQMAREYAQCPVYCQNYLNMDLPTDFFHGIFANASLFHVPKTALLDCLKYLHQILKTDGILFSSNPRGHGETMDGSRYAHYMELEDYTEFTAEAGFELLEHYYRPDGMPIEQRPWLACVFKKIS